MTADQLLLEERVYGREGHEEEFLKGHEKLLYMMDIFIILMQVIVSVYILV